MEVTVTLDNAVRRTVATIKAPMISTVRLHPSRLYKAGDVQGVIKLTGPASKDGMTVELSSSDPLLSLPKEVSAKETDEMITFAGHASQVTTETVITVTATSLDGKIVRHAKLTLYPGRPPKTSRQSPLATPGGSLDNRTGIK
jgi:hypothetical protein